MFVRDWLDGLPSKPWRWPERFRRKLAACWDGLGDSGAYGADRRVGGKVEKNGRVVALEMAAHTALIAELVAKWKRRVGWLQLGGSGLGYCFTELRNRPVCLRVYLRLCPLFGKASIVPPTTTKVNSSFLAPTEYKTISKATTTPPANVSASRRSGRYQRQVRLRGSVSIREAGKPRYEHHQQLQEPTY